MERIATHIISYRTTLELLILQCEIVTCSLTGPRIESAPRTKLLPSERAKDGIAFASQKFAELEFHRDA
jgi:hypothetical protein